MSERDMTYYNIPSTVAEVVRGATDPRPEVNAALAAAIEVAEPAHPVNPHEIDSRRLEYARGIGEGAVENAISTPSSREDLKEVTMQEYLQQLGRLLERLRNDRLNEAQRSQE